MILIAGGNAFMGTPHRYRHTFLSSTSQEPSCIESPVLKQVYPYLIQHLEKYGNPNIPLGTSQGRQCETLRRLQTQQKLTPEEVSLLENMGFRFDTLEDVYRKTDFDEMLARLLSHKEQYEKEGYQIPKKFPQDPELGAWVTGLRRLGPTGVDPSHAKALEEIGFVWKSNRKCGSAFMKQYREIRDRIHTEGEGILTKEESILKWAQAQREAHRRGALSETRCHYMTQLFGTDWLEK